MSDKSTQPDVTLPASSQVTRTDFSLKSDEAPITSGDQFLESLRESKLVPADTLEALLNTLGKQPSEAGASTLADLLVEARLLTQWQTEQLLKGQADSFILDRYRLLSVIGSGGMGEVYLAEHIRMRRRVALKILPPHFVDPKGLEMFYRESEVTAVLDHPNIVRAYDVGNEGETYYLVMEYVDGVNLNQLVSDRGPLHYTVAVEYLRQIAEGLGHAHERGIIHRDIKPHNLMLDTTARIKILDMGLSDLEEVEASPKEAGDKCSGGTPNYMAPEIGHQTGSADASSDIYSLGCTFYFLISGRPPFEGDDLIEILRSHAEEPPPSLIDAFPFVPPTLNEIYLRMMEKQPSDRYGSANDLLRDLNERSFDTGLIPESEAPKRENAVFATRASRKILVAEDDKVAQRKLDVQLRKAGFEVSLASDGRQAMDQLDADVSVCLFDLNMPIADGMECLRFVNDNFPNTPVIILTASGEIHDAIVAMREGAFDYLTKPCRINNVLTRIDEAIRARTRHDNDNMSLQKIIDKAQRRPDLSEHQFKLEGRIREIKKSICSLCTDNGIEVNEDAPTWSVCREQMEALRKPLAECCADELWRGQLDMELSHLDFLTAQLETIQDRVNA